MRVLVLLFLVGVLALRPAPAAAESCPTLDGTITVEVTDDPGFEGLYKYTVAVSWDVGELALSHLDVFLELETCECVCDPRIVRFGDPAGSSNGSTTGDEEGEPCEVSYIGEYACMGDESIPPEMNGPAIKFEVPEGEDCEPMVTGTGTFCFYSPLPPNPPSEHVAAIVHGGNVCYGVLQGQLPRCDCSVPSESATWGRVKGAYR